MGAKQATPQHFKENDAKLDADIALEAMRASAEGFLKSVRCGDSNSHSLGYKLTDGKLTDQEVKLVVKTATNAEAGDIDKAINSVFSGDWKSVIKLATNEIIHFVSGKVPKPKNEAVNEEWSKSYLVWEFNSLIEYSVFMKKTNAASVGTALGNLDYTFMCAICRGVVAYESVDPQVIIYEVCKNQPKLKPKDFEKMMEDIEKSLELAARLSLFKKQLTSGVVHPEPL